MARLIDGPAPYAVVVLVPHVGSTLEPPTSVTVNGRVARLIAWLIDHRHQIEHMRGALGFNFGANSFQAEVRETFPHQHAAPSAATGSIFRASQTETFAPVASQPSEDDTESASTDPEPHAFLASPSNPALCAFCLTARGMAWHEAQLPSA